jgi:DTW domain-containing protein YfiP
MSTRIISESGTFREPSTYDETCMEVLDRLDTLKELALETGDRELVEGLDHVFETFMTRYCDSKHAELNARMRRHFQPPKAYMN